MKEHETLRFVIGPEYKQQSVKQIWGIALSLCVVLPVIAYYMQSLDPLIYGFTYIGLYVLFSVNSRWPRICLAEDKLTIKNGDSLLWSKDICNIVSVEVEHKTFLFFKSKALLFKSRDGDSYYINVPGGFSETYTVEDIADTINESALYAQANGRD